MTPTWIDPTNQSPISTSTGSGRLSTPFEVPYGDYLANDATQLQPVPASGPSEYYQAAHHAGHHKQFSDSYICPAVIDSGPSLNDLAFDKRISLQYSSGLSSPERETILGDWGYSNPSDVRQIDTGPSQRKDSKASTGAAKKHYKRTKTQDELVRSPGRKNGLRSKPTSSDKSPVTESPKDKSKGKTTRSNHNQVEKQYRNRLNAQFENLLVRIPKDVEGDGRVYEDGPDKRISKSEVLVLAQKAIKELEAKGQDFMTENERLTREITRLKKDWVAGGGMLLPS